MIQTVKMPREIAHILTAVIPSKEFVTKVAEEADSVTCTHTGGPPELL